MEQRTGEMYLLTGKRQAPHKHLTVDQQIVQPFLQDGYLLVGGKNGFLPVMQVLVTRPVVRNVNGTDEVVHQLFRVVHNWMNVELNVSVDA